MTRCVFSQKFASGKARPKAVGATLNVPIKSPKMGMPNVLAVGSNLNKSELQIYFSDCEYCVAKAAPYNG
jgi:hypothetical protein